MTGEADDAQVIARSLAVPGAFAAVYERHVGRVLLYMRRRLGDAAAEDATTEVFVRAFKTRGAYVAQHPSALPWLYWLAGLVIADYVRAERRRLKLLVRLAAVRSGDGSLALRSDLAPEVVRSLRSLSPADRETLLLIAWGELSYDEVATATGVPIGTVRSRVARARAQLGKDVSVAALAAANHRPGEAHA